MYSETFFSEFDPSFSVMQWTTTVQYRWTGSRCLSFHWWRALTVCYLSMHVFFCFFLKKMFGKTGASGGKPLRHVPALKKPQVWGLSSEPLCCEATMPTTKPLCCLKHYSFSHVFPVLILLCHSLPSNEVSRCLPITLTVTNRINPNHLAGPCLNLAA